MSYVVGGCSTYRKVKFAEVEGYPKRLGIDPAMDTAYVYGEDDREYIDWTGCCGTSVLGSMPQCVARVLREAAAAGWNFPLPTAAEEEAAEMLGVAVGQPRVRWCKNGSDAVEAAVRIARYITGRPYILTNSYHGSHDCVLAATAGRDQGVLRGPRTAVVPCSTPGRLLAQLRLRKGEIAAVVMEPLTPGCQEWRLEEVEEQCERGGVMLVLDEVVTGFRTRYGSAVPKIHPDLAVYGKAIASGFPLAALTGQTRWMEHFVEHVYMSNTNAAEALSLQACKATLLDLQKWDYGRLRQIGRKVQEALGEWVVGYPQRLTFRVEEKKLHRILGGLARRGILAGEEWFPQFVHTDADVEQTVQAIREVRSEVECGNS